jgi:hypothetical protein
MKTLATIIILGISVLIAIYIRFIGYRANRPWLFKKQIYDDNLGRLWFNKIKKNPKENHFQAHTVFKPTNREIDIFFDSDENRLDPNQVRFYYEIENKYNDLVSQYIKSLKDSNLDSNFNYILFGISVGRVTGLDITFKLHYYDQKDLSNYMIQCYSNWKIIKIE